MKKFILEFCIIIGLSTLVGLGYNHFSKNPLPVFKKYDAHEMQSVISAKSEEAEVVEFSEIDVDTIMALSDADQLILLDARKPDEYAEGHLPKAYSLPISTFKETFPKHKGLLDDATGKTIVCYCIGIHCTDSSLLALELHKKGYVDIFLYKGGIEEWQQLGNPIETAVPGLDAAEQNQTDTPPDSKEVGNQETDNQSTENQSSQQEEPK